MAEPGGNNVSNYRSCGPRSARVGSQSPLYLFMPIRLSTSTTSRAISQHGCIRLGYHVWSVDRVHVQVRVLCSWSADPVRLCWCRELLELRWSRRVDGHVETDERSAGYLSWCCYVRCSHRFLGVSCGVGVLMLRVLKQFCR